MTKFTSLFFEWQEAVNDAGHIQAPLNKIKDDINLAQKYLSFTLFVQDYRDLSIQFVSDNVFDIVGYYPEHFYSRGIDLGLQILHPDDRSEVLVFQKKAFDWLKEVPVEQRHTISINHMARIKNRNTEQYNYIKQSIKPLLFDDKGNVIIDIATWQLAEPINFEGEFKYSFSYYDASGKYIKHSNAQQINTHILSKAEKKVLNYLLKGKSSKDIAAKLYLSKHTVDTHRRNILNKYKVARTTELISLFQSGVD